MTSKFSEMTSFSAFIRLFIYFDIVLFRLSSLVTGPSFIITSSGVMTIINLLWQEIDQKSGNRKYPRLSFAQYLETGVN